jgi:hypothetical protein
MLYSAVAIAALAGVAAAAPLEARKAAPAGWAHGYLEDYNTYHIRYIALSCYTQHNTTFFDDCCHPLLSTETLDENRKEYCAPNATALESASIRVNRPQTTSVSGTATATVTAQISAIPSDDTANQWVQGEVSAAVSAAASAAEVYTTSAAVDNLIAPAPTTTEDATTTTTQAPATTTTETQTWTQEPQQTTTETTQAPAETQGSSSSSGTFSGPVTWYWQTDGASVSGLGACGWANTDQDFIAAISTNGSGWGSAQCGQRIRVFYNGNSVDVTVVDFCPTCEGADGIDLSAAAFEALTGDKGVGKFEGTWSFI